MQNERDETKKTRDILACYLIKNVIVLSYGGNPVPFEVFQESHPRVVMCRIWWHDVKQQRILLLIWQIRGSGGVWHLSVKIKMKILWLAIELRGTVICFAAWFENLKTHLDRRKVQQLIVWFCETLDKRQAIIWEWHFTMATSSWKRTESDEESQVFPFVIGFLQKFTIVLQNLIPLRHWILLFRYSSHSFYSRPEGTIFPFITFLV